MKAALLFLFSFTLNIAGIGWSLPSAERSQYYPTNTKVWYEAPKTSGRLYQTAPFEPYHPDESFLLDAMSNMDPARLDFNPHFFGYPTLSIYLTAGVIKAGEMLGFIDLNNSKEFYVNNPNQIARIYLVGRLLAAVMSSAGVVLLYLTARRLFSDPIGLFSALCLAITPLWVRDSHFMLVNVPATSWMIACAFLAAAALKKNSTALLIVSAVFAGLAASTKYPGGAIVILPLFAVIKLKKPIWLIPLLIVVMVSAYLVGTPYTLVTPEEFIRGVFFEGETKLGVLPASTFLQVLVNSLGTVLFGLTVVGFVIAIRGWKTWENQFLVLWLLAGLFQSLSSNANLARYLIPALPPLAILAGFSLDAVRSKLANLRRPPSNVLGWSVSLLLLIPALGYSLNIDWILSGQDIRNQAAAWVVNRVNSGDEIGIVGEIYFDMPPLNAEKYKVVDLNRVTPTSLVASTASPGISQVDLPATLVLTSETMQFWHERSTDGFTETIFSQQPARIWTWPIHERPHDWGYTFLDIYIYEKSN